MWDLTARLEAAALSLTGPGSLKDRLLEAYCRHLEDIGESDLPGELGLEFAAMTRALHCARALPGDDVVRASIRKLSNDEARRYAQLVIRLYGMFAGMRHHVTLRSARGVPAPLASLLAAEVSHS